MAGGGRARPIRSATRPAAASIRSPAAVTTTGGAGSTSRRTASATCSTSRIRSLAEPHGTPRRAASASASGRPDPMPSSNRPPDSCCSARVSRTTAAALRNGAASTHVRSRSRDVTAAAAARAGNGDGVHSVSGSNRVSQPCSSRRCTDASHARGSGPGTETTAHEMWSWGTGPACGAGAALSSARSRTGGYVPGRIAAADTRRREPRRLTPSARPTGGDRLTGADDVVGELGARGDSDLPEHLAQVVLHGARAHEQLSGDLPVALPPGSPGPRSVPPAG